MDAGSNQMESTVDPQSVTGVVLTVSLNAIYEGSVATVNATAPSQFTLCLSCRLTQLVKGSFEPATSTLVSAEINGVHVIEVIVTEIVFERPTDPSEPTRYLGRYGMRFFPFVSSSVRLTTQGAELPVTAVVLDMPDLYRVIWYGARVTALSAAATLQHSHAGDRSKFIFSWRRRFDCATPITVDVPVRLGGHALARIATFPIYYWALAGFGVGLASATGNVTVSLASVGAAWAFMLQQWYSANLPQENVLLTRGYLIAGLWIAVWAMAWLLVGAWSLILLLPFAWGALFALATVRTFKATGILPLTVIRYWQTRVVVHDARQQSALVATEAPTRRWWHRLQRSIVRQLWFDDRAIRAVAMPAPDSTDATGSGQTSAQPSKSSHQVRLSSAQNPPERTMAGDAVSPADGERLS
jgi:hypothetical protein